MTDKENTDCRIFIGRNRRESLPYLFKLFLSLECGYAGESRGRILVERIDHKTKIFKDSYIFIGTLG